MLWGEFVDGTGCKKTEKNYKVYKDLEAMYMNTDLTKEQIYEYGKKLVDNSKTEEELAFEKEMDDKILEIREQIKYQKSELERYKEFLDSEEDLESKKMWKSEVKYIRDCIKQLNGQIRELKWVLE